MKFFIINSFRTMVYVAYIAIIVGGIALGLYNRGEFTGELLDIRDDINDRLPDARRDD